MLIPLQWLLIAGVAFLVVTVVNAIAFALEFALSFSDFGPLGSSARSSIEGGLFATARAVTSPMRWLGGYSALTITVTVVSETVIGSLLAIVFVMNKARKLGNTNLTSV